MLLQLLLLVKKKMAESLYSAFKEYILFHEDFKFSVSLYKILNEKHYVKTANGKLKFIMTYSNFKKNLRELRQAAKESCGVTCYKSEICRGHQVLNIMEEYENFMLDCVERRTLFYKYVVFEKIFDTEPMLGFILKPLDEVDLGWKSWSKRMQYLN